MKIIFIDIPSSLDLVVKILSKTGLKIYYINLTGRKELHIKRVNSFRKFNIEPIPISDIKKIKQFDEYDEGSKAKDFKFSTDLTNSQILKSQISLYDNVKNVSKKLNLCIKSNRPFKHLSILNIWARNRPEEKHHVIAFSIKDVFTLGYEKNIKISYIFLFLTIPILILKKMLNLKKFFNLPIKNKKNSKIQKNNFNQKIAFVVHQGLTYGKLFTKEHYYSNDINSNLHKSKILHLHYSNSSEPTNEAVWASLILERKSLIDLKIFFKSIKKSMSSIRSFSNIYGACILALYYVEFIRYSELIKKYKFLKVAIIDYDILCPKPLLLAFESKEIKTIAMQERFFMSFFRNYGSILNYYFTVSEYATKIMRQSDMYEVDNFITLGQYRTDQLLKFKNESPPSILQEAKKNNKKIIVVLGFHTVETWDESQYDVLINWKAHLSFLEDIIKIAKNIKNSFFVLRYKNIDWINISFFKEILKEINKLENLILSEDYSEYFISYQLCAHADLIIAKHTSIGDECLSLEIPVLFHEYSHNTSKQMSYIHKYEIDVMCFNFNDLFEKTFKILSSKKNEIINYKKLKDLYYGDLSDGKVASRARKFISSILITK